MSNLPPLQNLSLDPSDNNANDNLKLPLELLREIGQHLDQQGSHATLRSLIFGSSAIKEELKGTLEREKGKWVDPCRYGKVVKHATTAQKALIRYVLYTGALFGPAER